MKKFILKIKQMPNVLRDYIKSFYVEKPNMDEVLSSVLKVSQASCYTNKVLIEKYKGFKIELELQPKIVNKREMKVMSVDESVKKEKEVKEKTQYLNPAEELWPEG